MWSSLFRRRIRTFLTLFSIMIAFLLFGLLRSIADGLAGGFEPVGADRLMVAPKYSIIDPLPYRYLAQIRAVKGVDAVTHTSWFGGTYQEPSNFFPRYPVTPREFFDLYPEYHLPSEQLDAFANTRTGAVAPVKLVAKYNWTVGDKIPFEADIWPKKGGDRLWVFDLVGVYTADDDAPDPEIFLFNYDYFDEARQYGEGEVGNFIVRVSDPSQVGEVSSAIDALFENSAYQTRTATEAEAQREFANQSGRIGLIMTSILSAVFFTIVLLTGNTMAQALRERIPEFAVLKTLGFTDRDVSSLVLGEAVLLCLVGGALGIGIAALLTPWVAGTVENIVPGIELSWLNIATGLGLAALLGVGIGTIPAWTASRLKIVDALRERG
jgi:putative ABC transport system permease protein